MTDSAAEPNFASQTVWTGDNLPIMRGMNSETVDLVYLDPPFNSNADYAAPIGSAAAGAEFKDTWGLTDVDLAWCDLIKRDWPEFYKLLHAVKAIHGDSMMSYLIYMTVRLQEMHRLLKPTGSIWLHCDPTAGHYLKIVMDAVFGKANFRNEIIWHYRGSAMTAAKQIFPRKHDTIFFYTKDDDYTFVPPREKELSEQMRARWGKYLDPSTNAVRWGKIKNEPGQVRKHYRRLVRELGREPTDDDIAWTAKPSLVRSVWTDISQLMGRRAEFIGYPTQKPLALLRRIITASSNPGDTVLDPFCGCATACIAAEIETRRWVGIDISAKAADLVKLRMDTEMPALTWTLTHRTDIPVRSDLGSLPPAASLDNREIMYERQAELCAGCAEHFQLRNLTVDHVVPTSRGGSDHISNLQLLCGACNSMKGDRPMEYLARRLHELGLIDEAQQRKLALARAGDL